MHSNNLFSITTILLTKYTVMRMLLNVLTSYPFDRGDCNQYEIGYRSLFSLNVGALDRDPIIVVCWQSLTHLRKSKINVDSEWCSKISRLEHLITWKSDATSFVSYVCVRAIFRELQLNPNLLFSDNFGPAPRSELVGNTRKNKNGFL